MRIYQISKYVSTCSVHKHRILWENLNISLYCFFTHTSRYWRIGRRVVLSLIHDHGWWWYWWRWTQNLENFSPEMNVRKPSPPFYLKSTHSNFSLIIQLLLLLYSSSYCLFSIVHTCWTCNLSKCKTSIAF